MKSLLRHYPRLQGRWFSEQDLLAYVTDTEGMSTTSISQLNRAIGIMCCSFEGNRCLVYGADGNALFYLWHNRNYCTVEGSKKRHVHFCRTCKDKSIITIPSGSDWSTIYLRGWHPQPPASTAPAPSPAATTTTTASTIALTRV